MGKDYRAIFFMTNLDTSIGVYAASWFTTFAFERIYFWESTVWQITSFRKESCMFNI